MECAKAYAIGPIFNEMAKQIGDDLLTLEAKDVHLETFYVDKMGKELSAWKVTRFMH